MAGEGVREGLALKIWAGSEKLLWVLWEEGLDGEVWARGRLR